MQTDHATDRAALGRYAWLSIAAAVTTIILKSAAYALTGSVGLLSDALESFVNLAGALMALAMLASPPAPPTTRTRAGTRRPSTSRAASRARSSCSRPSASRGRPSPASSTRSPSSRSASASPCPSRRRCEPRRSRSCCSGRASATSRSRSRRTRTTCSPTSGPRSACSRAWALVALSGWQRLDPIVALLVAANIVWAGVRIVRSSVSGLMDAALPTAEIDTVARTLAAYKASGVDYHALRTRQAGARRFVSFHVLVPGSWTVQQRPRPRRTHRGRAQGRAAERVGADAPRAGRGSDVVRRRRASTAWPARRARVDANPAVFRLPLDEVAAKRFTLLQDPVRGEPCGLPSAPWAGFPSGVLR